MYKHIHIHIYIYIYIDNCIDPPKKMWGLVTWPRYVFGLSASFCSKRCRRSSSSCCTSCCRSIGDPLPMLLSQGCEAYDRHISGHKSYTCTYTYAYIIHTHIHCNRLYIVDCKYIYIYNIHIIYARICIS